MSGTRSRFLKAPATEVLVVAHGQPSKPAPSEQALSALSALLAAQLPDWTVFSATLASPNSLECAMEKLSDGALVYPFFMADGWFVRHALPGRLKDRNFEVLPPLGLEAALPSLAAQMVADRVIQLGWPIKSTQVCLAAHGSARSNMAANAALSFAKRLERLLPFGKIETGFIEQAPFVQDVLRNSVKHTLCVPFLACDGDHFRIDVAEALGASGYSGDVLPVFGHYAGLPEMIAESLKLKSWERIAA